MLTGDSEYKGLVDMKTLTNAKKETPSPEMDEEKGCARKRNLAVDKQPKQSIPFAMGIAADGSENEFNYKLSKQSHRAWVGGRSQADR